MGFDTFTSGQVTALEQVAALQASGQLVTNETVNSAVVAANASFAAPYVITTLQLDSSGNANIVRNAKTQYIILDTFGSAATDTLEAINEANPWSDGDSVYLLVMTGKQITVALSAVAVTLREAGDFVKLVRIYGQWKLESVSPNFASEGRGTVEAIAIPNAEIHYFASNTSIASVTATTLGTPAAAVYEITAISGTGGQIFLYVDGVQIGHGTDGSTIHNMGISLRDSVNAGTDFTASYNSGHNELTITDALNRGTLGNSFLLGSLEINGAAGIVTTQFTGGIAGTEAAAAINTINGLLAGQTKYIHNAMTVETLTLGTGGNLVGTALPLVIAPDDFAIVSCIVDGIGRVR